MADDNTANLSGARRGDWLQEMKPVTELLVLTTHVEKGPMLRSHDAGAASLQDTKTMNELEDVKVLFVAGFGPIVREAAASRRLYGEALGIRFKEETGGYLHTEALKGVNTFALWPLSQAAQSCFGRDSWPDDVPVPQAWLELDVDSVERATTTLAARGYRMLLKNKREPWGQIVSRFLSPEGLLIGITFTPSMREEKT